LSPRGSDGPEACFTAGVFSILIPFSVDAWWAERSNRGALRRTLLVVRADFEANAEQLTTKLRGAFVPHAFDPAGESLVGAAW